MKTTTATMYAPWWNTIFTLFSVNIKATTWDKDSQDLFDYESRRVQEKTFETTTSANLFRIDDDIFLDDNLNGPTSSISAERSIVTIKQNKGKHPSLLIKKPILKTSS